jgi:NTE family protein
VQSNKEEVALCLSGGGFRAALFHLGSLRRLNEMGILSQVDLVSAVSGGSMLASHVATHIQLAAQQGVPWPTRGGIWPAFDTMAASFHVKLSKALRIATTLSYSEVLMRKLPLGFKRWVGDMQLRDLPERPDFTFNATELRTGGLWSFSRGRVGSDELGYSTKYDHALVAEAVAASACYPAFEPLRAVFHAADFEGGTTETLEDEWEILFTDGGVFDNLGFEKVSNATTLLVSDGGRGAGPLLPAATAEPESPEHAAAPGLPASNQFESLLWILASRDSALATRRLEKLSRRFGTGEIDGAYWSIGSGIDTWGDSGLAEGYTRDLALSLIASIRTQLDAFSDAERQILENHGYLMAELGIRAQAPSLIRNDVRLATPWPHALSPEFVRNHLQDSSNISSGWRAIRNLFRR